MTISAGNDLALTWQGLHWAKWCANVQQCMSPVALPKPKFVTAQA